MCILFLMAIARFCNCVDTSHSKCLNTITNGEWNFFCARNYANLKGENHGGYGCAQRKGQQCDVKIPLFRKKSPRRLVYCLYFVMTAVKSRFLHLVGRLTGRLIRNGFRRTQF